MKLAIVGAEEAEDARKTRSARRHRIVTAHAARIALSALSRLSWTVGGCVGTSSDVDSVRRPTVEARLDGQVRKYCTRCRTVGSDRAWEAANGVVATPIVILCVADTIRCMRRVWATCAGNVGALDTGALVVGIRRRVEEADLTRDGESSCALCVQRVEYMVLAL